MSEREPMFDEMLDECYPTITIAGIDFYPADILAECDPIAYRVALHDWASAECSEGNHHSINRADNECDYCGETISDEEEDSE